MPIDIQALTAGSAGLLKSVATDVFDHDIKPEYLAAFLEDPRHFMYVALDEHTVVGMISVVEYFHPDKPPQLWINEVGVAASHRRCGIGRRLVEAAVSLGRERGSAYVWLGTDVDNTAAQSCFESVSQVEQAQPFLLYEWDFEDEDGDDAMSSSL